MRCTSAAALALSWVAVGLLIGVVDGDAIVPKTFRLDVPMTHCAKFGPESNIVIEWAVSFVPKNLLEVRFTTQSNRGFIGLGFANSDKLQVFSGYPVEYLPCARSLYDNFSPYDIDGNTFPNYPELPAALSGENISHTYLYAMRNLSNAAVNTLKSGGNVYSNVTILWAYQQKSLYAAGCYLGDVSSVTEMVTFKLPIGGTQYLRNSDGSCKGYTGQIVKHRGSKALKVNTPLLDGERHQNSRAAIAFVGANLMLESGRKNPQFATAGIVLVGDNDLGVCQHSKTFLRVHWNGFSDSLGGIQKYLVTAGTPSRPSLFLDRYDAGTNLAIQVATKVVMPANSTLVVSVTAINFATLQTKVTAKSVRVLNDGDTVFGKIFDGTTAESYFGIKKFQNDRTKLAVRWRGWLKEEHSSRAYSTGLFTDRGYQYAVGETGVSLTNVLNWVSQASFTDEKLITGLALDHGKKYSVSIRSLNCADKYTVQTSPGVTIDIVPPRAGVVVFGNNTVKHVFNARRSSLIRASWGGFIDLLSGIKKYMWALGPTKNPSPTSSNGFVIPWTDVGLTSTARNATIQNVPSNKQSMLSVGKKVYVYVKAIDVAGNFVMVVSNATTITN